MSSHPQKMFYFHDIGFSHRVIDDNRISINDVEGKRIEALLEKNNDVYVVFSVHGGSAVIRHFLMKAKFLVWKTDMIIPLEKTFISSATTSGYWGKLPTLGASINANKQIRYRQNICGRHIESYMEIVGDRARCYFIHEYDAPLGEKTCNREQDLSFFGL